LPACFPVPLRAGRARGLVIVWPVPGCAAGLAGQAELTGRCPMPGRELAGFLHDGAPYLRIGQGPPLVMVPGLTPAATPARTPTW